MPVSFRILPRHFLAYFRPEGWFGIAEGISASDAYRSSPDYRKGMRQLVDFSALTGWERDFAAIMREQARQVDVHDDPRRPVLIVILAPNDEALSLAQAIQVPWARTQRAVVVIVETEAEALAVLGIDAPSVAEVIEGV